MLGSKIQKDMDNLEEATQEIYKVGYHAGIIRETMGIRAAALILGILMLANLANTVSEFAGVAASMEIFGVSKFISIPVAAEIKAG